MFTPKSRGGPQHNMDNRIDDLMDAAQKAWLDEPEGLGKKFSELALSLSGLVFSPFAITKILKDQFLPDSRFKRIKCLLEAVHIWLRALDSQIGAEQEKIK